MYYFLIRELHFNNQAALKILIINLFDFMVELLNLLDLTLTLNRKVL